MNSLNFFLTKRIGKHKHSNIAKKWYAKLFSVLESSEKAIYNSISNDNKTEHTTIYKLMHFKSLILKEMQPYSIAQKLEDAKMKLI